ncbi:MAG TPA: biotin synthase [Burkholderiaceae bacterium]
MPQPSSPSPAASADTPLDTLAVRRHERRLLRADSAPWLHQEVARRMAEKLSLIKLQPQTVVQWGARLGGSQAELLQVYPQARQIWVERDAGRAPGDWRAMLPSWLGGRPGIQQTTPSEVTPESAELLWANMVLHGSAQPSVLMQAWLRALKVDGFVMFSCLGPDSFVELRPLFAQAGWGPVAPPWIDMHDLGDDLVRAGFAEPVMDQERITLTWGTPERLLADLRAIGGNVASARFQGLRTPGWRRRLLAAFETLRGPDGLLHLSLEVIYGHAIKPIARLQVAPETHVSLEQMRAQLRGRQ